MRNFTALLLILLSTHSYSQKFLNKYQKKYDIIQIEDYFLAESKGDFGFKILDPEGKITLEGDRKTIKNYYYNKNNQTLLYITGPTLPDYLCEPSKKLNTLNYFDFKTKQINQFPYPVDYFSTINNEKYLYFTNESNTKKGLIDSNLNVIYQPIFDNIGVIIDDLLMVTTGQKYFIGDLKGNNTMDEEFTLLSNGYSPSLYSINGKHYLTVSRDGVYLGLIDIYTKKEIIPFKFKSFGMYDYTYNLIELKKDKYFYLADFNDINKVVIDESFKVERFERIYTVRDLPLYVTSKNIRDEKTKSTTDYKNFIYKGKYLIQKQGDAVKVTNTNIEKGFISGIYKETKSIMFYDLNKEKYIFSLKDNMLPGYELQEVHYSHVSEKKDYAYTFKTPDDKNVEFLFSEDNECLLAIQGPYKKLILDPDTGECVYETIKRTNSSKYVSIYVDCTNTIVFNKDSRTFSYGVDQEKKLFYTSHIEIREENAGNQYNPRIVKNMYSIKSYYDAKGKLIETSEVYAGETTRGY